jgi:uncharacterized protein YndB with AHSA1/START domain
MKLTTFLAGACIGLGAVASAQTNQTETKLVTVDGEVVRYEPGNVIVIRGADNKEVSYVLAPSVAVPAEVVGRRVTLYTEPGPGGATTVSRVVSTSVTPEGNLKRTTEETRTSASGSVTKTQNTTISGEVVRYQPGRTIVLRQPDSKVVTYTLAPNAAIPADIKVGRTVTLFTEPGAGGASTVARVVSTSVTPEGNVKRTTEETRMSPSGETTRTTTTDISGRVEAYESGKTLTIVRPDGSKVTYLITGQSQVPVDLAIGKTVTILVQGGPSEPVARTVTYTVEK